MARLAGVNHQNAVRALEKAGFRIIKDQATVRFAMRSSDVETFVLCIRSDGYEASLEPRKVYRALPDPGAASKSLVRVIDESGEDYLYPTEYFVPIEVPQEAVEAFPAAT